MDCITLLPRFSITSLHLHCIMYVMTNSWINEQLCLDFSHEGQLKYVNSAPTMMQISVNILTSFLQFHWAYWIPMFPSSR